MKKLFFILLMIGFFGCASYSKITENEFPFYSKNSSTPLNAGTYTITPTIMKVRPPYEHLTMLPALIVLFIGYWIVEFKKFSKKLDEDYEKENQ